MAPTSRESWCASAGSSSTVPSPRDADSTLANFALTDGSRTLNAVHGGVVPDLFFNDHSEIILEGTYRPDGVFESGNVIVKCPSKYIASE